MRVSPLKVGTIPRLELSSALLGAQLYFAVIKVARCNINRQIYWTDSSVVLGLSKTPNKTKTFVANRASVIIELTDLSIWRHVPTRENPADFLAIGPIPFGSRGIGPIDLINCELW